MLATLEVLVQSEYFARGTGEEGGSARLQMSRGPFGGGSGRRIVELTY